MRLALASMALLLVACGGAEFSTAPAELLLDPPFDAGALEDGNAPDGASAEIDGGHDAPSTPDAAGDPGEASTDAGTDAPVAVGYCGLPFACGDAGAVASPPAVCTHGNGNPYDVQGAGTHCGTCATYTCQCLEEWWPTENSACPIAACDDSNGQVRVTCGP